MISCHDLPQIFMSSYMLKLIVCWQKQMGERICGNKLTKLITAGNIEAWDGNRHWAKKPLSTR